MELLENLGARNLKQQIMKVAKARVMLTKQTQASMIHMPTPQEWFKLQPNVCDNKAEKILNMFLSLIHI